MKIDDDVPMTTPKMMTNAKPRDVHLGHQALPGSGSAFFGAPQRAADHDPGGVSAKLGRAAPV